MKFSKLITTTTALMLSAAMLVSTAACGSSGTDAQDTVDDGSEMTIDVFDSLANYQGIQKGWFAKIVKDKFNLKLNMIAPNVSGGSTLFDTRTTAGNLGDVVIVGYQEMAKLVRTGLVTDLTPYLENDEDSQYIKPYANTDQINKNAGGKTGIYGVPQNVSDMSPVDPSETNEPYAAPYIRWDYYKAVGYPEMNNLDDLLEVLKQMQDKAREAESADDIYAISLFKDWDGSLMGNAGIFPYFYGYQLSGYGHVKVDGSEYVDLYNEKSPYYQALAFLNKANAMGLVDPESTTQTWDTSAQKFKNGKVLFSIWNFQGQSQFNSPANKEAGKGFMLAPIKNLKVYSSGALPMGNSTYIAVGSKAKNKARLVKFINWLYSPEGSDILNLNYKGLTYEIKDGQPVKTAWAEKYDDDTNTLVPDELGGGTFSDGSPALNFRSHIIGDTNPETGYKYDPSTWPSELSKLDTALDKDFQEHMGGAKTTMEYLQKNNMLMVEPGDTIINEAEDSADQTLRNQINSQSVATSWKAVFASESDFEAVIEEGRQKMKGLNYDKFIAKDETVAMENLKDKNDFAQQWAKEHADDDTAADSSK